MPTDRANKPEEAVRITRRFRSLARPTAVILLNTHSAQFNEFALYDPLHPTPRSADKGFNPLEILGKAFA